MEVFEENSILYKVYYSILAIMVAFMVFAALTILFTMLVLYTLFLSPYILILYVRWKITGKLPKNIQLVDFPDDF